MMLAAMIMFGSTEAGERVLIKQTTVRASLDDVWHAWTTPEGVRFISASSNIELRLRRTAPDRRRSVRGTARRRSGRSHPRARS